MPNVILRALFWIVLGFALYHLIRDIMQIVGVENIFTMIFHRPHTWCGRYCDWIMFPVELGAIVGATLVLQRNRVGIIGILTLLFPPILFLGTVFLP